MARLRCAVVALMVLTTVGCRGGSDDRTFTTDTTPPSTIATTTTTAPARSLSAGEIVQALKDRGLPIAEVKVYTAEDDVNTLLGRPGQYIGKANWHDSRVEPEIEFDLIAGGSVEVFASQADADKRLAYVDAISSSSSLFAEYHWLVGRAFLRVGRSLTPDQAKGYETAFRAIVA